MKNTLMQLSLLFLGLSLVACSTNTQDQNTALGAVAGGVAGGLLGSTIGAGTGQAVAVGVGAVTGAVVGGAVGHNMDSSDNTRVYKIMDYNPTNKGSTWTNKKTRASYTLTPTTGMMTIKGNPNCRKYVTTAIVKDKKHDVAGAACRQVNGAWKMIDV